MQHMHHTQYMQQLQHMQYTQHMQHMQYMQHVSHMSNMIPQIPYTQHNTAIRDGLDCFGTFTSKYSEPSINNCNYVPGLGCSPKTNVDEESSSCITPVTISETDGKSGRDEMTDPGSDPEYDSSQKIRKTNAMSMRAWYEQKGHENVVEPKNGKRGKQKKPKDEVTVDLLGKSDLLRQAILEYVFRRTGRLVSLDRVLRLTARHEKEKIIRYNEICLQHIVTYCIEEKCGKKRNHFPLCIDKCPHCPVQRIAYNKAEWFCVKSQNPSASHELRAYTSSYSKKQTGKQSNDVVKYSDLRLNVSLYDANATQPAISQQHKVKVMKGEYFNKIRTSTPKAPTQPLNLTYARFWVEIVKDCVYLCIVDVEALKAYDEKQGTRRPIKSAIGAYVDGRMEVELAIMSSIPDTEVVFEWFVHKNYVKQWFRDGLTLGLHLTGNKEMPDWGWYQTIRDTNIFVHNNTGYDQWPPMGYGPSGAPFDYQLPPQIIQPINNSYEQVCAEASYRLPENIASGIVYQPIADLAKNVPIFGSAMTNQSPTLDNFQAYGPSPSNFDTIRTEAIQENNELCQKKRGIKRKRSEMESETEGEMESHIMPLPLKRPVGPYRALYENDLAHFEQPRDEEWCPEMDPIYNRLRDSQ